MSVNFSSRLIIMDEYERCASKIAEIDMKKMGLTFDSIFRTFINYKILIDNPNVDDIESYTDKDAYGEHLRSCGIKDFFNWLRTEDDKNKLCETRRLKPLIGLLKGFNLEQWSNIRIIHYKQ